MRTYTLVFSIAMHVAVAATVLFTTVLATDELPSPNEASTFVNVVASSPPSVPPPAKPRPVEVVHPDAAPVTAPEGISTEIERALPDVFETAAGPVIAGFGSDSELPRDEPPPPPPAPAPSGPVRVGGVISAPTKIVHVAPKYPAIALASGIEGVVILEATIAEDGTVRSLRLLRSVPLLDQAALDAVAQWRFTPTLLNGQPVAVLMTVTVSFSRK
jgi:protein TonB